ncbi:MAG: hypothetical protein NT076_01080 [Candidatus Pacearchaeota archaeon]|nr:hypothetical protein [Candidatus Pacearchaeota archaeon]
MKKIWAAGIVIAVLIFLALVILRSPEDSWIKDENGQYVKHGNPAETPRYVSEQQEAVVCALNLYQQKKAEGMNFSSQCLGRCGNYSVDIVSVPRTQEDDKIENQCEDYVRLITRNFIELDKNGDIFRIM